MTEQTMQEELAQTQAQLLQTQRQLANVRTYARTLFFQNEDLRKRVEDIAFVEQSRAWRLIKHLRLPLRTLLSEGPFPFLQRGQHWLARNRRVHKTARFTSNSAASPTSPGPTPPSKWEVVQQRLPDHTPFSGVSIIIPVFNALAYAQACVESIYQARGAIPFEVIIVDNGSQPEVRAWLEAESRKKITLFYLSLSHNLGFAKAINLGIEKARGQYILMHNSDTVVTSGWLDTLVQAAESEPQLGIVSPVTNYVGEGLQIDPAARGISAKKAERYAASISTHNHLIYVPDRLVFFSVLVKRFVLETIGGLDEDFGLGNFEDEDFCLRARLAGFTLAIAANSFVFHHGSKTFAANHINHTSWMQENQQCYLDKISARSQLFPPLSIPGRGKEQIEVSVIMRTYNRPETLKLALASMANQTFGLFEVVLVNDGGQDISELLDTFKRFFPIRHLQHSERKGPGAGLNTGVRAAQGKWITYLDDDDIVYPSHIEALWTALTRAKGKYLFAYSDYNQVLLDARSAEAGVIARLPRPHWNFHVRALYANNYLPMHTWMHARECFEKVGFFDEGMVFFEDWDFLMRAASCFPFLPLKRMTCEYRLYLDTHNSTVQERHRHLEQLNIMYDRYPVKSPMLKIRRQRMRKAAAQQAAQVERLKEVGEQQILSPIEVQKLLLAITAGFNLENC